MGRSGDRGCEPLDAPRAAAAPDNSCATQHEHRGTAQHHFVRIHERTLADGRIVYLRHDGPSAEFSDIYLVNADGTGTVQVTDTAEAEAMNFVAFEAGDRPVFTRDFGGQDDLFSILTDGSDERRLTDTPAAHEQPRGVTSSYGVLYSVEDANGSDLHRIGADGNGFAVLGGTLETELPITIY